MVWKFLRARRGAEGVCRLCGGPVRFSCALASEKYNRKRNRLRNGPGIASQGTSGAKAPWSLRLIGTARSVPSSVATAETKA